MIRRPTVVVMLKEPRPGRVKTRLARDIGTIAAAGWFRRQTVQLLRRLEDPRWDLVLAVSPDRDGMKSRVWPAHLRRIPQGRGDLGDRMRRALRSPDSGPVAVIGADIPGIGPAQIATALARLSRQDAVIGPAPDGGFWLIALRVPRQAPATLFRNVRWSTEHARADTERSLGSARIAYAQTLRDVDTAADLAALTSDAPLPA